MFAWMGHKQPGWMGIGFFPDRVELAHVCWEEGGRPAVRALESYRREGQESEVLRRLRKTHRLDQFRCATLLAPGEYQLLQVDAPTVSGPEMKKALRWQLKDRLDYPVDRATVDGFVMPAEGAAGRRAQALAVAAPNSAIGARMEQFDAARLELAVIDIPELAQRNVARFLEDENRGLALLVFDATGGLLTITFCGELYAWRRIEVTAEQLSQATEERRRQLFERVVLELQRSLDNFDRQFNSITLSKLLVGSVPGWPSLAKELGENLFVPAESMDLARVLDCSAVPELREPGRQSQSLPTIGLALRPGRPE